MAPRARVGHAEKSGATAPMSRAMRVAAGVGAARTPPRKSALASPGSSPPPTVGDCEASAAAAGVPTAHMSLYGADAMAAAAGMSVGQAAAQGIGAEDGLDLGPALLVDAEGPHGSGNSSSSSSSSSSSGSSSGNSSSGSSSGGSGYVGRKRRAGGRLEPSRRPQSPGTDSNSRGGVCDADGSHDNLQEVFSVSPARRVPPPARPVGSVDGGDAAAAAALADVVDVDADDEMATGDLSPTPQYAGLPPSAEAEEEEQCHSPSLPGVAAPGSADGGAAAERSHSAVAGSRRTVDEHETTRRLLDLQMTADHPGVGADAPFVAPTGSSKRARPSCTHDSAVMCDGHNSSVSAGQSCQPAMDVTESVPRASADSLPVFIRDIHLMLDYVANKPKLAHCSASFLRDYIRTMLASQTAAVEAERAQIEAAEMMDVTPCSSEASSVDAEEATAKPRAPARRVLRENHFSWLPEEITKHVFSFLPGPELAKVRLVSRQWKEMADDEQLWKALTLTRWRSLATDEAAWPLVSDVSYSDPHKWRKVYPHVARGAQWRCRLQKTGRFICNLVAHHIGGHQLAEGGLPFTLIVERRFNLLHLDKFVVPEASLLYFEPESDADAPGFFDFIEYLLKRSRAGLALDELRRFIFVPPCEFATERRYTGPSLLGVVQDAFPPINP